GRSPGHGHDHAHRRDVDARLVEELGGAAEDPDVVLVEAEHDPEVDGDPVAVQEGDEPAVVVDAVVRLVRRLEALLRDRLEAQEQRLAAAPRRELDELLVARGVGSALARPPLSERREGPEELLRVARVRAAVVVPEYDRAVRARGDLTDDLVDGTVSHGPGTVEERDRAIVAAVGTAPRRDRDRLPVSPSLDEVPARGRHAGQRCLPTRDVDRVELSAPSVVEDARPCVLGLADDNASAWRAASSGRAV